MSSTKLYSNHLINESSTYLLQHAHNPVDWYPWGAEALERAVKEDKPILLSIGYAACHWCHVMERESFEDEETAELMNRYFINIKVDREERPDIDHIYMDAVQAMTGSGGWPLNVFITPELKPFYGGTYFPPVNAHNRMSWKEVLQRVDAVYRNKKEEIQEQAERLTEHLISSNAFGLDKTANDEDDLFSKESLQTIADNILKSADKEWGGFGKAPKFPQTFSIQYLLRHYHYSKDEQALEQATYAMDKMIYGGIYDQIGGGFSRYSTDHKWQIPHFEKMLYDNALLLNILAEGYQITGKELYANAIRQSIGFLKREMLNEEGGFYSALDADSEGIEGKYYVWSKEEIDNLLGGNEAEIFCRYFQVTEEGNWEESNILWSKNSIEEFAKENSLDIDLLKESIHLGIEKLLTEREKRIRPQLDDKILLNWNALMITGLCKSFEALQNEHYKELAVNCMKFVYDKFCKDDGTLWHVYKNGKAKIDAFLDDYAYTIQALIALNNITGDSGYIKKGVEILKIADNKFKDKATGLYYYTDQNHADIIVRKKELYDGATPSANAVMMNNLIYLSAIGNDAIKTTDKSADVRNNILSLKKAIINHPTSFGIWAMNIQLIVKEIKVINIHGINIENEIKVMSNWLIPEKIILTDRVKEENNKTFEMNENGQQIQHLRAVFNVCTKYTCSMDFVNLTDFYNYLTKA